MRAAGLPPPRPLRPARLACLTRLLPLLPALLLGACSSVGPEYHRPELVLPQDWQQGSAVAVQPLEDAWWQRFGAADLDVLVERALQHNPGIAAGQAALRSAELAVRAQQGATALQMGASVTATRSRTADVLSTPLAVSQSPFNLHTAQLDLSYTPDVFGLNRRAVEGLQAQADNQRHLLAATRITLAANVVNAVIMDASLRAQIANTEAQRDSQQQALRHQQALLEAGAGSQAELGAQAQQLALLETQLSPLRKQRAINLDLLKSLLGDYPQGILGRDIALQDLALPSGIPPGLPSALLERRPDVRAAEDTLHAASAAIGVAQANRLPSLTLGVSTVGQTGTRLADLFTSAGTFWSLAGGLSAPLLDGGTLAAREQQAHANYDQAAALYRQTVLNAFQGVADALQSLQLDADAAAAQTRAATASAALLRIARAQVRLGDLSVLSLLPIEQAARQADLALIQARSNQLQDVSALCLALGAGWPADH